MMSDFTKEDLKTYLTYLQKMRQTFHDDWAFPLCIMRRTVAQIKQATAFYEKGGNSDVIFPKG
jgi:hypothetical protein